jgi:hypothetical protein
MLHLFSFIWLNIFTYHIIAYAKRKALGHQISTAISYDTVNLAILPDIDKA